MGIISFLAILAIWFGYKKARATGRSGILWGLLCGGIFIGIQLLAGIGIVIGMVLGIEHLGWNTSILTDHDMAVSIGAVVPGIVALWLLFRYLDRVPDVPSTAAPPAPPTFDRVD